MLVLKPVSMRKIWGTERLHAYCGDPSINKVGLVYSASAISSISNRIDSEDFEERDFHSAVKNNPGKFGLPDDFEEFPIIVSFTAADADLSIQVHPTDGFAQQNEGKRYGKSESWYFIDAPQSGWIYVGSKEMDKNIISDKMARGDFEDVIGKKDVKKGDLVFIPSGTLHALTAGSLVYEIQQSTDITYRFYDFDRLDTDGHKRELHTRKAIETLRTEQNATSIEMRLNDEVTESPYTLSLISMTDKYHNDNDIAQIVTILEGEYLINQILITPGMSIVVFPNETIKITTVNNGKVMVATPII